MPFIHPSSSSASSSFPSFPFRPKHSLISELKRNRTTTHVRIWAFTYFSNRVRNSPYLFPATARLHSTSTTSLTYIDHTQTLKLPEQEQYLITAKYPIMAKYPNRGFERHVFPLYASYRVTTTSLPHRRHVINQTIITITISSQQGIQ